MTLPEKKSQIKLKKKIRQLSESQSHRETLLPAPLLLSQTQAHTTRSHHCRPSTAPHRRRQDPLPLPCFRATSEKTSRSSCLPVDQREPCPSGPLSRHDKFPFPFLPADGGTRLHRIFGSGHRARVVGIRLGCRSGWPLPTSHRLEEAVDGGMVRMSEPDSASFRPGNSYIQVSAGRRLRTRSRGTLARPPRQQLDATNYAETTSWITW